MRILTEILKKKFCLKSDIQEIENVVMDSRKVGRGALFFAINSGNNYIDEVLQKGAILVVADNYNGTDERVIKVDNTVLTMQKLAREYREALGVKLIGITGSNGKTTTKDMIYSLLSQKFRCKKTEGNYNNHIGLPFTILQLQDEDEVSVLEMGMSGFGEIDRLCDIARPDYGVITNIGDSHLEYLKTRENVFRAKGEMIKYIKPENLILFGDDFYLRGVSGIKVGYEKGNDWHIESFLDDEKGITFKLNKESYKIPLNGKHNCINGAIAIVVAKKMGLSYDQIERGFENLNITPMRFQKIIKGETIYINDAYNASPISMRYSLETFDTLYNDGMSKIVALGDMLELGENEIEFHKEIIQKALTIRCDKVFLYGERMSKALKLLEKNEKIEIFLEKNTLKSKLKSNFSGRKVVLLKGSRGMKMEEIIEE